MFKRETLADGSLDKYKARVVAKGFSQRYGEDYSETFSPVMKHSTLRMLLVLTITHGWFTMQLDVKTAFLNSVLHEEVYLQPPEGCVSSGIVWRLKKALYGLKQASRAWYELLSAFLLKIGFSRGVADPCLFWKVINDSIIFMLVYVDDLMVFSGTQASLVDFYETLATEYAINKIEGESYFVGLELIWNADRSEVHISQRKYVGEILKRFQMSETKPKRIPMDNNFGAVLAKEESCIVTKSYRPELGALLYASTMSRPDITTAVRLLAQRMDKPTQSVAIGIKRVMQYLQGTRDLALKYSADNAKAIGSGLVLYVDAAFASEPGRKSATGYAIFFHGNLVAWGSKSQSIVTLSSTEA